MKLIRLILPITLAPALLWAQRPFPPNGPPPHDGRPPRHGEHKGGPPRGHGPHGGKRQQGPGPRSMGVSQIKPGEPGIVWYPSLRDGITEAKRSNRPIFFMAAASQCRGISGVF